MCVKAVTTLLVQGVALAFASGLASSGAEVTVTRTNWAERQITNLIDVTMPRNRFVDEYRTNWVTVVRTNVVDVYRTNWSMEKVTNVVEVAATWTNRVVAYRTNWTQRFQTNAVAVGMVRTNFVERYQTNWSVLDLTNWQTVVLFKTNWIQQPVTNLVRIDLPEPAASPTAEVPAKPAELSPVTTKVAWPGPYEIIALRTARPSAEGLVEIHMKVRSKGNAAAAIPVQRWRVESEDGTMLFSGQDPDFKRQLPTGKYRVEARLQSPPGNPPVSARATLSLTAQEAAIQPRLVVQR